MLEKTENQFKLSIHHWERMMRRKHEFMITDVFGESRYTGNQLATFLNAGDLDSEEMLQIAREIHFSETTFVASNQKQDGGYDVRIFTPACEIDFAGHPALGTAYLIWKYVQNQSDNRVVLHLKAGKIPVEFISDISSRYIGWMQQLPPEFRETLDNQFTSQLINLSEADIDYQFPVQIVSTGLPTLIIPVRKLTQLKQIQIDLSIYQKLIARFGPLVILVFSPEPYSKRHQLSTRVFPICYDIPEDPATGSSNGCLAGYLVKYQYWGSPTIDIQVGQGYEIGRPSTLYLKASQQGGQIDVSVGGRVIEIARGEWY